MIKAEILVKDNRIWIGNYLIMINPCGISWCVYQIEPAKTIENYKRLEQAIKYCMEN